MKLSSSVLVLKFITAAVVLCSLCSCATDQKISSSFKPNKAEKILDNDKDTLFIKPNTTNANNEKLIFYLHGSAGPSKYSLDDAFEFANFGFNVVHLCWYNCNKNYSDDLDAIEELDLEKIAKKIDLVLSTISWKNENVFLVGMSRGAEAVALLISHPELSSKPFAKAVIISGISVTADARKSIPRKILNDRLSGYESSETFSSQKNSWAIGRSVVPSRTPIEVKKFKFPLMIIHGELDQLWTVRNAYQLKDNYNQNGSRAVLEIVKESGHHFPHRNSSSFLSMIDFLSM